MQLVIEQLKKDVKHLESIQGTDEKDVVLKHRARFIEESKRAITILTMHKSEDKENENS